MKTIRPNIITILPLGGAHIVAIPIRSVPCVKICLTLKISDIIVFGKASHISDRTSHMKSFTTIGIILLFLLFSSLIYAQRDFGVIDPTFNNVGYRIDAALGTGRAGYSDMLIQKDGAIVELRGHSENDNIVYSLRKLDFNGSVDTSFGTNGIVRIAQQYFAFIPTSLASDEKERLYVGGVLQDLTGSQTADIFVYRFNPDGTTDLTFGQSGKLVLDFSTRVFRSNDFADRLLLDSNGQILLVGESFTWSASNIASGVVRITRLNDDGSIDNSFGNGGTSVISVAQGPTAIFDSRPLLDAAVDEKGEITVVTRQRKYVAGGGNTPVVAMCKFFADGSPDLSFGTNGVVGHNYFFPQNRIGLLSDGSTIALWGGVMLKFRSDGSHDNDFGSGGKVFFGTDLNYNDLFIDSRGRITLVGEQSVRNTNGVVVKKFGVISRFLSNGALDGRFGSNGTISINSKTFDLGFYRVKQMIDGRFVAAGYPYQLNNQPDKRRYVVARYLR